MKLQDIRLSATGTSCASCGHAIRWLYTVRLDTEVEMVVGSDCAMALLSKEEADQLRKRARAAAAQWRKKEPGPLPGESREDYINRRIAEMSHAFKAWQVYVALLTEQGGGMRTIVMRILKEHHIPLTEENIRGGISDYYRVIEQRYGANRFDFAGKTAYRVRRI